MSNIKKYISQITDNKDLSRNQSIDAFNIIMSGEAKDSQVGAFLSSLKVKGESLNEIIGGATVLRNNMKQVKAPNQTIDIVGTGGDSKGTFNISTTTAIVTASCGVHVAKHGNKAVSSKSGSADILKELGVNINIDTEIIERSLKEVILKATKNHELMV